VVDRLFCELDDDPPDVSSSELESELEEDTALRFNLLVVGGGLLPSSESESESELELESEVEGDSALCFDVLGSSSSSESEVELEETSEDDVAGFFARKPFFLLLPPSLKVGTELESVSTSESSLESEPVSSVDSSSLSTSSAEESVLLESRWVSFKFATCGTTFWGASSLSSLLSSKSL
jgi:hypothetical protein